MKKALFSLFIALIFSGCSKSGDDEIDDIIPPKIIPIESIDLGIDTVDLKIGESYKFEYSISPSNTTDSTYKVTLKSLDNKIAILKDDLFTIQSLGIGSTYVVAYLSTNEKITDTCIINVLPIKEERIEISETESYMIVGDEMTLTAQIYPSSATFKEIKWSSSNEQIATVDNGIVRALAAGEVSIFAESKNGLKAECKIVVDNIHVEQVFINNINSIYMVGDVVQLSYGLYPDNAFNKNVRITSYNQPVVTIDDDLNLHAVSEGVATIIIESEDGYALTSYEVTVGNILSFVTVEKTYCGIWVNLGKLTGEVHCQFVNNSNYPLKITSVKSIDSYGNILMFMPDEVLATQNTVGAMQNSFSWGGEFDRAYEPKFVWGFEFDGKIYELTYDIISERVTNYTIYEK